ncbi:MAG: putative zinc-binding protein [Bacillota bacterium]
MLELELVEISPKKVGIIPCNGEELPEGTLTRFACRKVLDKLKPSNTVTICLPLFIAGGKEEREFAQKFPTITVDGCDKQCSRINTERLSGKPRHSIVITDLLKEHGINVPGSARTLVDMDRQTVDLVAKEIAKKVDQILAE